MNDETRSELKISPGDFVVVKRPYNWAVVTVSSVTALQFKASGEWSSRDHSYRKSDAVFSGPESRARNVCDQLTSSAALYEDERRKSGDRHRERDSRIIAKAHSLAESSTG